MLDLLRTVLYYPILNLFILITEHVPGHNAAWSIVILTVLIRLLLLVPSQRAAIAQRKMSELQPKLAELRAEYGTDQQGMAMAQMRLFRENNVNPYASCLPTLLQLVVMLMLYQVILHGFDPKFPHLYAWVPRPSEIHATLFGLNLLVKDHTYILPILAGIAQFFQVRLMTPPQPKLPEGVDADPSVIMSRQMQYVSPVLTFIIGIRWPAAVSLYWVVSTTFGIVQQYFVNQHVYRLQGVEKEITQAGQEHPENRARFEKVKEVVEKSSGKDGVNVTVRRKK